jgi:hypothetical protein
MSRGRVYGGLPLRARGCAHGCQDVRVAAQAGQQNLFPPLAIAMSRRLQQRRQFDESLRERLIDEALARYFDWLAESESVNAAYGRWSSAARTEGALPFAAYAAALDREERAATVYRSVVDQVERLFGGEERVVGAPQGATRA